MLRPRTVAVDSGSSLLLLDPKSIDALRTYLQTQHGGLPGVLVNTTDTGSTFPSIFSASVYAPESSCLVLSEDYDWSAWPSIELLLDAVTISIPAPLYFIEALPNIWCFGVAELAASARGNSQGVDVIIGDVVLRGLYVIFHRDLQQIGFAAQTPAVADCGMPAGFSSSTEGAQSPVPRPVCAVSAGYSARTLDSSLLFYISYGLFGLAAGAAVGGVFIASFCYSRDEAEHTSSKSPVHGAIIQQHDRARQRAITRFTAVEILQDSSMPTVASSRKEIIHPSFERPSGGVQHPTINRKRQSSRREPRGDASLTFEDMTRAGLTSENFDVAANIGGGDSRTVDATQLADILQEDPSLSFDLARAELVNQQLREAGIDPATGLPFQGSDEADARWLCPQCSFNNRPSRSRHAEAKSISHCKACSAPRPLQSTKRIESDVLASSPSPSATPSGPIDVDRSMSVTTLSSAIPQPHAVASEGVVALE
eukprot:INCI7256.16.p1 GENE.INCI7256.16~~INCI7256.16.p1  ORF type:complete len:482 (+),score=81.68 INCI7256.16:1314-2759(+)